MKGFDVRIHHDGIGKGRNMSQNKHKENKPKFKEKYIILCYLQNIVKQFINI